jgi:hypothetical protein
MPRISRSSTRSLTALLTPPSTPPPLLFPSPPLPDPSLWSCPALWDGQVRRQHTEHSRKPFLPSLHHRQGYPSSPALLLTSLSYSLLLFSSVQIVQQSIKCLQALSSDDITHRLVGIFLYHNFSSPANASSSSVPSSSAGAGTGAVTGVCPSLYREHVANCLQNTLEEVYRLQVSSLSSPVPPLPFH